MTLEELKTLTNISLFHYSIYVILRCRSSGCLALSIKSDLDMRFTIWSLDVAFQDFYHAFSGVKPKVLFL